MDRLLTIDQLSEILGLKWDRVDLKAGFIRLKPEDTKTKEGLSIPPVDPTSFIDKDAPRS